MMDIFEIQSLSAGYEENIVLKDINCKVKEGEFVAIIGANGTGKSTLLKVLSGIMKPSDGEIYFKNESFSNYSMREFSKEFSVVHQFYENLLAFSVYDFIRLGRFPHQKVWQIESIEDSKIINEAMEITEISHLSKRPITELSGGEQQLVFIARALVQNSSIIILDEPVSHLDIKHSSTIMDILHSLNRNGTTIIVTLHDINLASNYCNRIIGLKDGCIFFDGTPEDVTTSDNIEKLFNAKCIITKNPVTGNPFVCAVPGYIDSGE